MIGKGVFMKKFVTALPPDASEKEQFYAAHASSADQQVLLQDYIALFIKKNHLESTAVII